MTRRPPPLIWLILLVVLPGCGDTVSAVLRDYYNVEHEILDNMSLISDEDSAKKFNELCRNRLKHKEEDVDKRREKIEANQYTDADRKALAFEVENVEGNQLKMQIASLDTRFRILQNRQRRLIVKLTEEKAAELKNQGQSFKIDASSIWQNLSTIEMPEKFTKSTGGGGGGMGMPMMPPMPAGGPAGPGAAPPGAPGMPAGGPAMAGGAQAGAPQAPKAPPVDPRANQNLRFIMICERVGNGWDETRSWQSGGTVVFSNKGGGNKLEVNGIDLTPLSSN